MEFQPGNKSSSSKKPRRPLVVFIVVGIVIAAGMMSAGPVAAQSVLDKAREAAGIGDDSGDDSGDLSQSTMTEGLREALRLGSERVVGRLGREGGFNADPDVHIPLPETLRRAQSLMEQAGMGNYGEELELRLNRAAEAAVPEARDLFFQSIRDMSIDDARNIVTGPEDAATQYFKQSMSPELRERMRPIVTDTLSEVGAVQVYQRFTGEYRNLPMVPDLEANLSDYTVDKALDGVFHYMAREEAAIRNDPARRTTDLLKKVFGGE